MPPAVTEELTPEVSEEHQKSLADTQELTPNTRVTEVHCQSLMQEHLSTSKHSPDHLWLQASRVCQYLRDYGLAYAQLHLVKSICVYFYMEDVDVRGQVSYPCGLGYCSMY